MRYFIVVLLLIAAFFQVPELNGWAFRQVAGLGVLSVLIAWKLSKKYHPSVGVCFLVTSIFGLFQAGLPQLGYEVVSSIMALLFFSCMALCLKDKELNSILPILSLIAKIDALIMIVRAMPHIFEIWGFEKAWWVLTNASLDACFLALMSPIVWMVSKKDKMSYVFMGLIFIAILLSKSHTALAAFLTIWSIIFLKEKEEKSLKIMGIALILCAYPIYFFYGMKFGQNYGRFGNWQLMMQFWLDHFNYYLGAGPGSYWVYSQVVQAHKLGDAVFTWMHNDWLQVLFEQGYIGFACVLYLYIEMLFKSFKDSVTFAMIIGFGLIAGTMYPLHLFYFQLVGVGLIHQTFRSSRRSSILRESVAIYPQK